MRGGRATKQKNNLSRQIEASQETKEKKTMGRKKADAKASRSAKRKERRRRSKQAASANRATVGARVNSFSTGGNQLRQDATRTAFNTNPLKADKNVSTHKEPSSPRAKDVSGNLDSLSIRGGHDQPFRSFNLLTVNAHGAGEGLLTVVNESRLEGVGRGSGRNGNYDNFDNSYRKHQEKMGADWGNRRAEGPGKHAGAQSDPVDVHTDHQELRLDNLGVVTLRLAGETAKQVCLEATFEFLQKRIPTSECNDFWTCVVSKADLPDHKTSPFAIVEASLEVGGRKRSIDLLLSNCITTLSSSFDTPDAKMLKTVLDRAITLCDALDDTARRDALQQTLDSLDRHVLVLGVKETELHRAMNNVLTDKYDISYPPSLDGKAPVADSEGRRREEGELLRKHKDTYDGFKKPLRKVFVDSLQKLVAMATDK